jgi:ribulose-5-phosphate 4-epimerase/fuculose-1-phosphate aldolase
VSDKELKQELCEITTELYHAGVITASGGNLSVRSTEREDAAWITPSQIFKGSLKPDLMCLIDFDGKLMEGDHKASVESVYHGGIFRLRPEINAVVHSHAPLATLFGMCDIPLLPITTEAIFISDFPVIEWYLGGSKDLAKAVLATFETARGAFLRNHGLITTGKSLRKAADSTLMVEETVNILLKCKMASLEPSVIPEKAVNFLKQFAGAI